MSALVTSLVVAVGMLFLSYVDHVICDDDDFRYVGPSSPSARRPICSLSLGSIARAALARCGSNATDVST